MSTAAPAVEAVAWRFFETRVAAVRRIGPSFVRLTLTGPDLDELADNGWDQRLKVLFPDAHGGYAMLPTGPDWYAAWRALPPERQNPIRTYTVRAVRPQARELDVDLVLHGDAGPASRFATRARVGDEVVLLGPNARFAGAHGGLEFRPPAGHVGPTLLAGDATAVPAILNVLGSLPAETFGEALLEVSDAGDITDTPVPPGFRVTWLVHPPTGSALPGAVRAAVARLGIRGGIRAVEPGPEDEPDPEDEPLWDVPEQARVDDVYAWLAGESSLITGLRRYLVRDLGVDPRAVAFMGYWREGRPGG